MEKVKTVSAGEFAEILKSANPLVVLDVRRNSEREFARIALPDHVTDLFIPVSECQSSITEIQTALGSGKKPILVYCHHGVRSMAVANWLVSQGIENVLNLDGGIDAWSTAVDPKVPQY